MKTLYLNHNGFFEFCKGYGESKTIKFPFNFLRLPPAPPAVFLRIRKFLVLRARLEEARPRRGKIGVTTRSARKSLLQVTTHAERANYQSLRDCCSKKVRAKRTISPPNETSARESEDGRRAEGAQWGRKWRRVATKAEGDGTEKWAVLSLVSYLKYNFLSIII